MLHDVKFVSIVQVVCVTVLGVLQSTCHEHRGVGAGNNQHEDSLAMIVSLSLSRLGVAVRGI